MVLGPASLARARHGHDTVAPVGVLIDRPPAPEGARKFLRKDVL